MKRSTRALVVSILNSDDNICRVCFKPGIIRVPEKQEKATVITADHEDGTTHTWLKYDSLTLLSKRSKSKLIVCPKCGKRGTATEFRPDSKNPLRTGYIVKHGFLEGTWGKEKKTRKQKRCWIYDKKNKDIIAEKFGRYIPEP